MLIDTHTHLYSEEFKEDIDQVIQKAIDNGIEKLLLPNIDVDSIHPMLDLTIKYPENCFAMMGLHPGYVKEDWQEQLTIVKKHLFENSSYIAVGEIGIDLYWDKTFKEQQIQAFSEQIKWAKELKLPIVIHVREAFNEVFEVLDKLNDEHLTGIFHCFTGTFEQAQKAISYGGFKLGIGGVVTYKNSTLPEVLKQVSIEKIVVETDSPYLPPVPYRGKRNESSYVVEVAYKLMEIYQLSYEEIKRVTSQNATSIFTKIK